MLIIFTFKKELPTSVSNHHPVELMPGLQGVVQHKQYDSITVILEYPHSWYQDI